MHASAKIRQSLASGISAQQVIALVVFIFFACSSSQIRAQDHSSLVLPAAVHEAVRLKLSGGDHEPVGYEALAVFVKNDAESYTSNPVQGKHEIEDGFLTFRPSFPFERGMTYVVRTPSPRASESYHYTSFQVGQPARRKAAGVAQVFPSAELLPENMLRFYIYFHTPMKKGELQLL